MIRPNIIKIICHDIGKHLGCYGVKSLSTSTIDYLAKEGILFNNAFATSPGSVSYTHLTLPTNREV